MSNLPQSSDDIRWACTGGGPLIAVEECRLLAWHGSDAPTDGRVVDTDHRFDDDLDRPACDYDLSCAVDGYCGLVDVGDGHGLVLGDLPDQTTWWPLANGGILVKWIYAERSDDLFRFMSVVPDLPIETPAELWRISDGRIHLFDSAYDGRYVLSSGCPGAIAFSVSPGDYSVSASVYEPDELTMFILHRLTRVV